MIHEPSPRPPQQFQRNHAAIHDAQPGTCPTCDLVRKWTFCPACRIGEHRNHQRDFLNPATEVTLCRCPIDRRDNPAG